MRKLRKIEDKNNQVKTLKDLKLPSFILNDNRYNFHHQEYNEPDAHYIWKCHLGYYLHQYVMYNTNRFFNPNNHLHPFFSKLNTHMLYYEHPHVNVKVVKVNELTKQIRGQYYYKSDIFWLIRWNYDNYHILIEINGGVHTKNKEQKTNNRIRYNQIKEYYEKRNFMLNNSSNKTRLVVIIFNSDEWKYHETQYFIDIIINTILEGKDRYPDIFEFELKS